MEIQKYINLKKELQVLIIEFIENPNATADDIQNIIDFIKTQKYQDNQEEFKYFFQLLLNISNYHHRMPNFLQNIKDIIFSFEDSIKKTFSNNEIFNIFKGNKSILLFLIQKKILILNEFIFQYIEKNDKYGIDYCCFLYPEIKEIIDKAAKEKIEKQLFEYDSNIFNSFDEKRQNGENDSYICSLIREDKVEEFIIYINQENIHPSSSIPYSIFETNRFLIENKNPALIEYAAFFGSIQIIQYLKYSQVELFPSLWLYSIHSKNPDLIHLLEENQIEPPDDFYVSCLLEAIKCHHNDIANYIKNNLVDPNIDESNRKDFIEKVFECCFHYSNYSYFPHEFSQFSAFFNLCKYNYSILVNLYLKKKGKSLEERIILY